MLSTKREKIKNIAVPRSFFLEFGREILTRDLEHTNQTLLLGNRKKQNIILPTYGRPNEIHDHKTDEKSTKFFFFCAISKTSTVVMNVL